MEKKTNDSDSNEFNQVIKDILIAVPKASLVPLFTNLKQLLIQRKVPPKLDWIALIHALVRIQEFDNSLLTPKEKKYIQMSVAGKIKESQQDSDDFYSKENFANLMGGIKRGIHKIFME